MKHKEKMKAYTKTTHCADWQVYFTTAYQMYLNVCHKNKLAVSHYSVSHVYVPSLLLSSALFS